MKIDPSLPADNTPKLKISYNGQTAEGSFLLDNGAQLSMISNAMAQQLHITHSDPNDLSSDLQYTDAQGHAQIIHNQFSETIGGAGNSTINAPGFYLDSILVHTLEATSGLDSDPNNLNFLHVPVLVADITSHDATTNQDLTLDGIFGMNLLTTGGDLNSLIEYIFGLIPASDVQANVGAFDYATYDQAAGTLGLTLAGSAVPEPSTFVLGGPEMLLAMGAWYRKKSAARA